MATITLTSQEKLTIMNTTPITAVGFDKKANNREIINVH